MAYEDTIPPEVLAALNALTPESRLIQINAAIAKAEVKQRYRIGDRELFHGDLRWMYPERARLEAIVARRRRGGMRFKRVIPL